MEREPIERPGGAPLVDAFRVCVERDPAAPLLLAPDRTASRAELRDLAAALHRVLPDPGPQRLVAVAAADGPAFLAALLAVWRRGLVPLLLDRDTPAARRLELARALGAAAEVSCTEAWPAAVDAFRIRAFGAEARYADAALIKLTSGSTGAPRGIRVSAAALVADSTAIEQAMGIGVADRVLAAVPMSFSYGLGSLAIPALIAGRQLVVAADAAPLGRMAAARRCAASVLPTVPVFLEALLHRPDHWELPPSLRLVISAGAPLAPHVALRFRRRFGRPVHVFYGASECGGITYDPTGTAAERGTVGVPVPGVTVAIDPATDSLSVRSPSVACGYLPEQPAVLDGVAFHSSDCGRFAGAELQLTGRHGLVFNIGGNKVNPREVEQAILRLNGVDDVHVMAVARARQGSDVCCAVVATRCPDLDARRIRSWCQQHLAPFQRPRRIVLVPELPRSPRGKLRIETIQALLDAPPRRANA
ncbi:MAG: acyl--CoA ligase [Planctomycetes bacterium]|nr:acyl--CoA ligase [Planctomycetota bacterium]MCB9869293.1 acyl--CoA ligase [Planctomycetota bacterium]